MFIVSGDHGTGKTRALVEKAKTDEGLIVCADTVSMRERAHSYGITGLNIISYEELYEYKVYSENKKPIYIDDINAFIRHSFPEVKGYTVNIK